MRPLSNFLFFVVLCFSCNTELKQDPSFTHEFEDGAKPWNKEIFTDFPEEFSFAIISDLNGGERPGVFDQAIQQINLLRPEFVMSVGDLVNGGTENQAIMAGEFDHFDNRASQLVAPIFHVGGNHDLTNPEMQHFWEERYGRRFYHFLYKNVLFLVLDSEDYETIRMLEIYNARASAISVIDSLGEQAALGMEYFQMPERNVGHMGEEQLNYFKAVLEKNPKVNWTFIFMHKPLWKGVGSGSFEPLEELLKDQPYTVIGGHEHSYSNTMLHDREHIILGTTGGSQNSEDANAYDHISMITVTKDGPVMANLKLDGILDSKGKIPYKRD